MTTQTHRIPVTTTFSPPPGTEIAHVVGPVWGITVRSRSAVGTACAGCQSFFGGEITAFTELAHDARSQAMKRLEENALKMGADCILGMRFDSGELMNSANEVIAYGTGVKLRRVGE